MQNPVINEFVRNHTGTDFREYVEIFGDPDTDLSDFWVLQIEGDNSPAAGTITSATRVGSTNADGIWVSDFTVGQFQNGTQTLLLVKDFTGTVGQDLDTFDDGEIDAMPFSEITDSVAVTDSNAVANGDITYSSTVLDAGFDGGVFDVGGASRIPNGIDTDTAADWVRNDFFGEGLPGLFNVAADEEAVNTPGALNALGADVDDPDEPDPVEPPLVRIYDIQGAGHVSAFVGQTVSTLGVVTAVDSNGFYMQDSAGDGDIATSDGIFVFTGGAPGVSVGNFVTVEGRVDEFFPGGEDTANLSITQITGSPVVEVVLENVEVPDAVVLGEGGRQAPTEVVEDDAFGSFDPGTDGIDFYESLEGMRVTVPDAVAVAPTNGFGEIWTVADTGDNATGLNGRGGIQLGEDDQNPERIQIDFDGGILPGFSETVDVGDKLGDVTGVVTYSFGNYEVAPTEEFDVVDGGLEQETTDLVGTDDQVTVASYNVLNLDPSDVAQIETLAQQFVNNLKSPDIVALQEIQDNNGTVNDGTTDASQTLQALVDAIEAAGGPTYSFFDVAPEDGTQGGQPGGNIRVAYLYNDDRVDLVDGSVQALDDLEAFDGSRIPLQAEFEFNGEQFTVINNHWSSKFGSTPIYGAVQPFVNAGNEERKLQAEALNEHVSGLKDADPDAKVIVLGDLNDFEFSEPLPLLKGEGDEQILFDQIDELDDDEVYTFNFQGNSQVLDHFLVTENLKEKTEFDIVHVNNDFASFGSDHEPLIGRIKFDGPSAPQPTNEITLKAIGTHETGIFDDSAQEIVAHDPETQRLFVTNSAENTVDVLDISDPTDPQQVFQIDLSLTGGPNSVDVHNGIVAVALEDTTSTENGIVAFFDADGNLLKTVSVGALPDMLTFTDDGMRLLVANEGEPDDGVDPNGSISIIDLSNGLDDAEAIDVDFTSLNGREEEFIAKGVRIFPGKSVGEDVEPEFISVSGDGKTAFVVLQENNAFGVIDLETGEVVDLVPLGVQNRDEGAPTLQTFDLTSALPDLGTTDAGQTIKLGGLSGLHYVGTTEDGKWTFATVPDRGPNADTVDVDGDGVNERPLALPDYQARIEYFEVDPETGEATFTESTFLTRFDSMGNEVPITGRPNIDGQDEEPVDLFGNPLELDPFGADMEGVVFAGNGDIWTVDEYRPAIYQFNSDGLLINRFVPEGTAALAGEVQGSFGAETLPEEYAERRPNRGFEAVALDEEAGIVYAFIQTPLANPDRATSDGSDVIRILGIDIATGEPVQEFVYLLEGSDFRDSKVDKIGDAVYAGDGKFFVIERDSSLEDSAKKFIFEIDLKGATNLLDPGAPALPPGETLESLTADELADLGIDAVNKVKVANLPSLGYQAGDKPEGLTILPDGSLAVLNDNDFSLTGDIDTDNGTLGLTDETLPVVLGIISFEGNGLDASDKDGIDISNAPIYTMFQPDAIDSYVIDGKTFYVTANEGDSRDEDVRVKDIVLDPEAFPNAAELQLDENLGRLEVSAIDGDIDGDGDFDQLFAFGGRSFSIWDDRGNLVFDSGDQFEQIIAEHIPEFFNSNNDDNDSFDSRSDNKGPEPEGLTIGEIDGQHYAFVGLERVGGIMVYNISDPTEPEFVQYINNRDFGGDPELGTAGDLGPEGLTFIHADDSPNGKPLVAVANEVSGTTTIYEVELDETPSSFQLQILHASDLEGGIDAIAAAPNFAAIEAKLESEFENSITISAGDNYISGPFFNAASDFGFNSIFVDFYNEFFDLVDENGEPDTDIDGDGNFDFFSEIDNFSGRVDISIMNLIGFDASALGNHEFDLGPDVVENIINFDPGNPGGTTNLLNLLQEVDWPGIQFPYLSANLDFSGSSDLADLFTNEILLNTDFQTDLSTARDGGPAQPKIAPSTIIDVNGEEVGVIGATTPLLESISSPEPVGVNGNVPGDPNDMSALAAILQVEIDRLTDLGVNKIILTSHLQQFQLEQELATLLRGVDVIIAGGSDTIVADDEDVARGLQPGDTPDVPDYPLFTQDADGNPVAIVSTDGEYSYVGRLVIEFDADGNVIPASVDENVSGTFATTDEGVIDLYNEEGALSDQEALDAAFAEGTVADKVKDLTDAVTDVVNVQDGNIQGLTDVFLQGSRTEIRTQETNFGNLTADANLAAAQDFDNTVMVSIKNGGGIRAPIGQIINDGDTTTFLPPQANPAAGKNEGEISQLDIANSLRFNNGLTLITLTKEQLLQVLEHGVAATGPGATPGQFAQLGGIAFSFDATQPAGSRVQSAALIDENGDPTMALVENGNVVGDPTMAIRIVTLDFLADGGDGYPFDDFVAADPVFANRVDLEDETIPDGASTFAPTGTEQDALAEFLRENFSATPFDKAETDIADDARIQNLEFRDDTVLDGLSNGNPDAILGTEDDDVIDGTSEDDDIEALGGDDRVRAGDGDDNVLGGDGEDRLKGDDGDDVMSGGDGRDRVRGNDGDDDLRGDAGRDRVFGDDGDDLLDGGDDDDWLFGGEGDDVLLGGNGFDAMRGHEGNDLLNGGAGADVMRGGADADEFVFDVGTGRDKIVDFEPGIDTISLNGFDLATFQDVLDATTQLSDSVIINFDDANIDRVRLVGIDKDDLSEGDFVLNPAAVA